MSENVILLAVIAYIGNMFKTTIGSMATHVIRLFVRHFECDTIRQEDVFTNTMEFVRNLKSTSVQNSISVDIAWDRSIRTQFIRYKLAPGKYFVRVKGLLFLILTINRFNNTEQTYEILSLDVIGLGSKKYFDNVVNDLCQIRRGNTPTVAINDETPSPLRKRTFKNLFIENKAEIVMDVNNFINSQDFYDEHEIPYKLGILLSGKPGTGKTSFIIALAYHLNWDVLIVKDISKLEKITKNTIVVFEDVNCRCGINREKPKKEGKKDIDGALDDAISKGMLDEMLQLLDGLESPTGVIFVLTTNHKEDLDPALFRPGRITLDIEMDNITRKTAIEMCDSFKVPHSILEDEQFPINPSYLQGKIIRYIEQQRYSRTVQKSA